MKILFIVPYTPNLIRVRPYQLIRSLLKGGHEVTVLTLWSSPQEQADAAHLGTLTPVEALPLPRWRSLANCLWATPSATPLQAVYCWQPALARRASALARHFDVVHVEHLRGAQYGLALKKQSLSSGAPPVVWDSVDSISLLFRQAAGRSRSFFGRWLTRFELGRTERYERWLAGQFDALLVTSANDRNAFGLDPASPAAAAIEVLPNGVDLEYFSVDSATPRQPDTLVISGKMSYHANVTMTLNFVQNILPLIWAQRPGVKLWIVGKDPAPQIQALARDERIRVTGTVSDIRPYLRQAAVAVTPIAYGVGIQNKVLEAMACATPVVSTPQAVSALQAQVGQEVLAAQEAPAFAAAVLSLLQDPQRSEALGQAGRRYVEAHHQWPAIAHQLEAVYQRVIHTCRSGKSDQSIL